MVEIVSEFRDRLDQAMKAAKPHPVSTQQLADHLGVSYQAIKKLLNVGSNAMSAKNTSVAAAFLGVSSTWLATGKGKPTDKDTNSQAMRWPFPDIDWDKVALLTQTDLGLIQGAMLHAAVRLGVDIAVSRKAKASARSM